jgi:Excalibur calcium-binding domain
MGKSCGGNREVRLLTRVLAFLGWCWVGLLLIATIGAVTSGNLLSGLGILLWGLIFLPPLWRQTSQYGLAKNIIGRIIVFVMVPVIFPSLPQNQAVKPVEQVPQAIATPTTTSTVVANPSLQAIPSPSITATPTQPIAVVVAPKAIVTPTDKVTERIYIPVYQNPITPKKVAVSPTLPTEIQTNPKAEVKRSPASKPKQPENRTPVTNGSTIPAQSGNCKELRARGIENIDVKANPWASRLDRDKDGVACESTNR